MALVGRRPAARRVWWSGDLRRPDATASGARLGLGDRRRRPLARRPRRSCRSPAPTPGSLIDQATAAVRADASDTQALLTLGLAWYQHARETADPSDYGRADEAFDRLLAIEPDDTGGARRQGHHRPRPAPVRRRARARRDGP